MEELVSILTNIDIVSNYSSINIAMLLLLIFNVLWIAVLTIQAAIIDDASRSHLLLITFLVV